MTGVSQGSRLEQLEALRRRLDHEIAVERRRKIIAEHRPTSTFIRPPRGDEITRALLDDLGVTPKQVKHWAVSVGLIPAVVRGRVSLELIRAYATAKGLG